MTTIGCVILSYNKAWIFRRFWQSLEDQTRWPDKFVVVDDGSSDGTRDLIHRMGIHQDGVVYTGRIGQSEARNLGLSKLTTDLVIFLDGDLLLQSNMLGRMEQELKDHPEVSFVYSHYDRTGAVAGKVLAKPWDLSTLKQGNYVSPMAICRRADLPTPCFDPELPRYEDWDLWLRMGKSGKQGRLIDETLFTACYQPGDLSSAGESQDFFGAVRQKHGIV
jgi:glycosyltransferase involved in cell wall biosynthesis